MPRTTSRSRAFAASFLFIIALWPIASAARSLPYGQGILWRVETSGAAPSHVFGTAHSTDKRIVTLAPPVTRAFSAAKILVFEMVRTKDMPLRMATAMMLHDGRRLDAILGPDLFARTSAAAARFGIPGAAMVRMKPWAISALISVPMDERARQATGQKPLDHALQARAMPRGIRVHGLETVREQLGIFDDLPEADQIALLERAIADAGQLASIIETVKRYYLARDLDGMFAWMKKQTAGESPRLVEFFEERIINARNLTMATRMKSVLAEGGAFIAIGALHLPGEKGVLSRLARNGYRLTRVY